MTDCATGDSQPHFTTLSAFVSGMGEAVAKLFAQILLICDRQGLIGREMFAIDGVKLPAHELITRFEQKIQPPSPAPGVRRRQTLWPATPRTKQPNPPIRISMPTRECAG